MEILLFVVVLVLVVYIFYFRIKLHNDLSLILQNQANHIDAMAFAAIKHGKSPDKAIYDYLTNLEKILDPERYQEYIHGLYSSYGQLVVLFVDQDKHLTSDAKEAISKEMAKVYISRLRLLDD